MRRATITCSLVLALVACPSKNPDSASSAQGSASSGSGGIGGAGGANSVSASVVSSGSDSVASTGAGGAKPDAGPAIDCATLNPGFTCVEDNDCPPMTKDELDACGPWSCVVINMPDPDAGIPPKRGCVLPPKP